MSLTLLPFALLCAAPDSTLPDLSTRVPLPTAAPRRAVLRAAVPAALFAYGLATYNRPGQPESRANDEVREQLRQSFPRFETRLDDYTRHAPTAAAYVLPMLGVKGRHDAVNFTLLYFGGRAINDGLTSLLKHRVGELRPGATPDRRSFPSSHTSNAFFSATLLHEQYREQSPWISVGGYAVATATGAMRMLNDNHWLSDVAAGAAVGIVSAEVAWHLYPLLQRRLVTPVAQRLMIVPLAGPRMAGLSVAFRPDGGKKVPPTAK